MPVVQIAVCQTILQSAIAGGYGIGPYGDNTVGRYALGAPGMTICYAHVYIIKSIPFLDRKTIPVRNKPAFIRSGYQCAVNSYPYPG